MFTDRFIKLPIRLFDQQQSDLTNKRDYECDYIESFKSIYPLRIESYEPAMPKENGFSKENLVATYINMQSEDSFLAFLSIDEFEKLLNEHQK